MSLLLAKNIYKPDKVSLSADKDMALQRRFQKAYEKMKDNVEIKDLLLKIQKYRSMLKDIGIEDYQVP